MRRALNASRGSRASRSWRGSAGRPDTTRRPGSRGPRRRARKSRSASALLAFDGAVQLGEVRADRGVLTVFRLGQLVQFPVNRENPVFEALPAVAADLPLDALDALRHAGYGVEARAGGGAVPRLGELVPGP